MSGGQRGDVEGGDVGEESAREHEESAMLVLWFCVLENGDTQEA